MKYSKFSLIIILLFSLLISCVDNQGNKVSKEKNVIEVREFNGMNISVTESFNNLNDSIIELK